MIATQTLHLMMTMMTIEFTEKIPQQQLIRILFNKRKQVGLCETAKFKRKYYVTSYSLHYHKKYHSLSKVYSQNSDHTPKQLLYYELLYSLE